ncbi:hypothetical protein QG37_05128 [Candidozyma auris]|nr:hypothetical protein QG37_05128 [[Candida] auris]
MHCARPSAFSPMWIREFISGKASFLKSKKKKKKKSEKKK